MPLRKRLESELCSEWKEQALRYKELQREAEELVGSENEESAAVFKFHVNLGMEKASEFYELKVKELQGVFSEVKLSIMGVHNVHKDREKAARSRATTSPSTSTDHLWSMSKVEEEEATLEKEEEERAIKKRCFAIWQQDAATHPRKVCLSNFVDENFMLVLEESALKDALREFLQMLVYIDRIRNFALLNSIIAIKLAHRHCVNETAKEIINSLHALPMFAMTAINAMVPEIEEVARTLRQKLSSTAEDLPSTWSLHVCPFCSHTATNAVLLPIGRTCCWKCAAESASDALIYCPLTNKPVDIKGLRLERILVSFLRRFFPASLKDAPAMLTGGEVQDEKPKTSMGLFSALKAPVFRKEQRTKKASLTRRQRRLSDEKRPSSLEIEKLDLEVSAILKGLASPALPGMGTPKTPAHETAMLMPLRRRDRSVSMPCDAPPDLDELLVGVPKVVTEEPLRAVPRNLRGFPLCSATCWCIERQASACIDFSQPV